MYSVPQDTDAPCRRRQSDNQEQTQPLCNSLVYTCLTLVPSEVFSNHASKFVAVWLTEFRVAFFEQRIIRAPTVIDCVLEAITVDETKILKCPDNLSEHNQFCSAILDC